MKVHIWRVKRSRLPRREAGGITKFSSVQLYSTRSDAVSRASLLVLTKHRARTELKKHLNKFIQSTGKVPVEMWYRVWTEKFHGMPGFKGVHYDLYVEWQQATRDPS